MPATASTHFALHEGQFCKVVTTPIATPAELINQLSRDSFSAALFLGTITVNDTVMNAYMRLRPDGLASVFVKLPFMMISSPWILNRNVFTMSAGRGAGQQHTAKWTPSPSVNVFFGFTGPTPSNRAITPRINVRLDGTAGEFILPMPNIYPDGRVCMGGDFHMERGEVEGLLSCLERAVNHLFLSPWNSDLMDNGRAEPLKRLIRFDANFQQLDHTGTLRENLIPYSNAQTAALSY